MKYYLVTSILLIPDEIYSDWGSSCDETFHGPGQLHTDRNCVISYKRVDKSFYEEHKNDIFTDEGGI